MRFKEECSCGASVEWEPGNSEKTNWKQVIDHVNAWRITHLHTPHKEEEEPQPQGTTSQVEYGIGFSSTSMYTPPEHLQDNE